MLHGLGWGMKGVGVKGALPGLVIVAGVGGLWGRIEQGCELVGEDVVEVVGLPM